MAANAGVSEPLQDSEVDAVVTLLIHCGIAAADSICCSRLGEYAAGDNHEQAVKLVTNANADSGKHLRVLLSLKSKAAYSDAFVSADDYKRARRAAETLLGTARRLN